MNDLRNYPRPIRREPVIRIRHVFLAAFCVALFSTLMIMEPLTIMIEVAR